MAHAVDETKPRTPAPRTPAPARRRPPRHGTVTGARFVLALLAADEPLSSGALAEMLELDTSYARQVCRDLMAAGILGRVPKTQPGTPPVLLYFVQERVG